MNRETAVKVLRRISGKTLHNMELWSLSLKPNGKYHLKLDDAKIEDSCPVWTSVTEDSLKQPTFEGHRIIWVEKSLYVEPPNQAGFLSLYHKAPGYVWNWDYGQICGNCLYASWKFLITHYGFKGTRAPKWLITWRQV